jgi:predicted kinase
VFVLLNGSFGIGKTTVAELLARSIPGAQLYNPEDIGSVLMRLPAWTLGLLSQPGDFQELRLWRRLIGPAARLRHVGARVVVVPMAFSNLEYLDTFASDLAKAAPVHRLCLVAPLDTVRARLEGRGAIPGTAGGDWVFRRARECVEAHTDARFGQPIDATTSPVEIVTTIRRIIGA